MFVRKDNDSKIVGRSSPQLVHRKMFATKSQPYQNYWKGQHKYTTTKLKMFVFFAYTKINVYPKTKMFVQKCISKNKNICTKNCWKGPHRSRTENSLL